MVMWLERFYRSDGSAVFVSPAQASRFAKEVAGDWNPIHDADSRRFCVPGDLLFAIVLARYGLSQRMRFSFKGMVGEGIALHLPTDPGALVEVSDASGKVYLEVERGGPVIADPDSIERFTRRYVAFSGRNFPHYLKPLMAKHGVMFNPDRPLVIYDSMGFELQSAATGVLDMELDDAVMDVPGKRAEAVLHFRIRDGERDIGYGRKKLIISGLRPYDEDRLQAFIDEFSARIDAYDGASRETGGEREEGA